MNKFIKFAYYNGVFIIFTWIVFNLYKVHLWMSVIGAIFLIILFVYLTPKILSFISDNF